MKKFLIAVVAIFLIGCGEVKPKLSEAIAKSYKISKGMTKEEVSKIIKQEPTSIQRMDKVEIWKYEGIETNEDTEETKYIDLIIKFVDGKVDRIGYFSCKIPNKED